MTALEDRAALLIQEMLEQPPMGTTESWAARGQRWLADYHGVNQPEDPDGRPGTVPGATRWRPIDSDGNISPNPAPENPPEPDPVGGSDDGETGPPIQELGEDPGEHDPISAIPSEFLDGTDDNRRDPDG